MYRTIDVVKVRREYISRPLIYTPSVRDVKPFDRKTVNGSLASIDDRVVAVDSDSLLVIRNGK